MISCLKWRRLSRGPKPALLLRALAGTWALASLISPGATPASAQDFQASDSQIKAVYLYNFGKFVTWPSDRIAAGSLEICVLGKDPFGGVLDATVNGESINHKKIVVQRVSNIQDAASCNILYISSSEEARLAAILATTQRWSLLTVSDMNHFAERGGVIGLVAQQERIRFEVNLNAAGKNHLSLSSELLKVATRVIPEKAPGS